MFFRYALMPQLWRHQGLVHIPVQDVLKQKFTKTGTRTEPCSCYKRLLMANLLPAYSDVRGPVNCKSVIPGTALVTREEAGASVHASWTPYPTEPDLEGARAASERLHSETIFPAVSTSGAPSWGAEAAPHTDGSLSGLCTLLQKTRLIDGLDSSIARCAELQLATPNVRNLPSGHCFKTSYLR